MKRQEIQILLVKAHYQLLSEGDKEVMARLLEENEEARKMQSELAALMDQQPFIPDNTVDNDWKTLLNKGQIKPEKKANKLNLIPKTVSIRFLMAVASVLIVIGIGTYILLINQEESSLKNNIHSNLPSLKLENGDVIVLESHEARQLSIEGVILDNQKKELHIQPASENVPVTWSTLSVPNKMIYKLCLPDSTVVWVNSATELRFPNRFEKNNRSVELLAGEAYFDVSENRTAPFKVITNKGIIQVLGTRFNINNYDTYQMTTSLLEGSIKLQLGQQIKIIKPMEAAISSSKPETPILLSSLESSELISWKDGVIAFDLSLEDLSAYILRFYDRELVFDAPALKTLRFRGKLDRQQRLEEFVETINLTGEVYMYIKNNELHVRAPSN